MSDIAIRVEDLSKQYRIGAKQEGYKTLRDTLTGAFVSPFRRARRLLGGQAYGAAELDETIWALKEVSFEIKRGEVVGIIGRNGAGKTTLLKILSRITEPTEGYAEIHGRVGSLLEVGTGFHPELTGRENIYLNGAILGMKKAEIEQKFDQIVDFAEIEKFIYTPVKHYSSGMYMRLAFAVAAYLEPEILLVDEVLAVGDAAFQKKCLGKMEDVATQGRTVLFVSHNMAAVEQLCSRAILLSEGHVKESGSVSKMIELYLSSYERQSRDTERILARSLDGSLELISIKPVDGKGRDLSLIQCGLDLNLSILIRTNISLPSLAISIGINNLYDSRVAVLHSSIAGYKLSLDPGDHFITCRVPRFPLSHGSYVLDVKVISGKEVILWAPRLEELSVEVGDFYNTGKLPELKWGGFCHLQQTWEVRDRIGGVKAASPV